MSGLSVTGYMWSCCVVKQRLLPLLFIFKRKNPTQPLFLIHTGSASVLNSRSTAASGSSKNEPIPRLICGHPIAQDPRTKTSPRRIVWLMSASPTFGKPREENCREFHTNLGSQITKPKPTVLQVCTQDCSASGYPVSIPLLISWGWTPYQPAATEQNFFKDIKTWVLERGWRCRNQVRSKRLGQTSLERAGRPGEAVHTSNSSTCGAAASGSLNSKSVWATVRPLEIQK